MIISTAFSKPLRWLYMPLEDIFYREDKSFEFVIFNFIKF